MPYYSHVQYPQREAIARPWVYLPPAKSNINPRLCVVPHILDPSVSNAYTGLQSPPGVVDRPPGAGGTNVPDTRDGVLC